MLSGVSSYGNMTGWWYIDEYPWIYSTSTNNWLYAFSGMSYYNFNESTIEYIAPAVDTDLLSVYIIEKFISEYPIAFEYHLNDIGVASLIQKSGLPEFNLSILGNNISTGLPSVLTDSPYPIAIHRIRGNIPATGESYSLFFQLSFVSYDSGSVSLWIDELPNWPSGNNLIIGTFRITSSK